MEYVKYISQTEIEYPPRDKGSIINYNINYELLTQDGFKQLVPVEKPETNRKYHIEYVDNAKSIAEVIVYDETQEEADARDLEVAKEEKITENDTLRDEALIQGVMYENVLFDSDTDQKVNLLATVSAMGDEDTIIWFGMDNQPLECTKLDLINIGSLITMLHSFCWERNYEIKAGISEAETIEELETIEIDYTMPTPEPNEEPEEPSEEPEE